MQRALVLVYRVRQQPSETSENTKKRHDHLQKEFFRSRQGKPQQKARQKAIILQEHAGGILHREEGDTRHNTPRISRVSGACVANTTSSCLKKQHRLNESSSHRDWSLCDNLSVYPLLKKAPHCDTGLREQKRDLGLDEILEAEI